MMASSNLDHHVVQDELQWPPLAVAPSLHTHGWSQPLMLNYSDHFISEELEILSAQRDPTRASHHELLAPVPHLSSLMVQELGFQWINTADGCFMSQEGHNLVNLAKIKEEASLPKFCGDLTAPSSNLQEDYHVAGANGLSPAATAPGDLIPSAALACLEGMVHPSVNISRPVPCLPGLQQPPLTAGGGAAEMGLQAFDVLAPARLCKSLCQGNCFHSGMPFVREQIAYGSAHIQEAAKLPSINSYKMAPLVSGAAEARGRNTVERTACHVVSKKPRFESRSPTISSFKGRKEKLGDRIAALQQLVAPFGKTDTASVLMEAIGYIKFLQDQVETLSVPYMRSSKKARTTPRGSSEERDEAKLDLRSRGLCLVPLSCTSYVTNENGGVWTPPNYYRRN